MELSRQRLRPSLSEGSHVTCPRCNGTGHIRDTESSALQVLRIIQEEAMKENSAAIHVQAPVDVAAFLLNEKRGEILKIETRHRVGIILIPNKHLETPHYKLERLKHDDPRLEETQASYAMAEQADTDIGYSKTQKEEGKPRQEAVVKGITPDQPAPIVERKPVEARPAAVAASPAEAGFLSKIFGFFFSKPAAPAATPAASAEAKSPQQRGDRGDRNNRGQRGRNRGGRNRDGSAQEGREDNAKKPLVEAVEAKNQQARPPRPPREPKEQREPREAENKSENRNEGRRERSERPPRPPREERKENLGEVTVDETLLKSGAVAAAGVAATSVTEAAEPAQIDSGRVETKAGEQDEEPRRRRRRGGRNRNRRDRDSTEGSGEGSSDDIESGEATAADVATAGNDAVAAPATPVSAPVQAEPATPVSNGVPMMAATVPVEQEAAAPAVEATPAPTVLSNAIAAPLVPQQVALQPEAAPAAVEVTPVPAPALVIAAPVVTAPVVAEPEPAAIPAAAAPAQPVLPEVAATAISQPVAEPQIETAAPVVAASVAAVVTPVVVPVVEQAAAAVPVPAPAPAVEAPAAIKTAVSSASPKVEDLQSVLAAAGLTLAATDPSKLRAAQEATASIVPAPRVPRERKPLPAQSSEPLVQVETQRP
jgi:ribonuclease E